MESFRIFSVAFGLGIVALAANGCSVTIKTQQKFTDNQHVTLTEQGTWTNQVIEIENANGEVIVNGVANLTQITVDTVPFAFADDAAHQSDATQAIADVAKSVVIDESQAGKVYIHCAKASQAYGTAGTSTTGCDSFTVNVPAAPLALSAKAHNGDATGSGITAGQNMSVVIHSDNGSVTASLAPSQTSTLEASSSNGSVTLALPNGFSADSVVMSSGNGTVSVEGFSTDFTAMSTSRGPAGTGAALITAHSDNGDVVVKSQ